MKSLLRLCGVIAVLIHLSACTSGEERKLSYLESAQQHLTDGNIKKAGIDVRNALQIDENYIDARFVFAQVLEAEENWEQVIRNLRFIIDADPGHAEARIKFGTILLASSEFDMALEQANTILESNSEYAEAHALVGAVKLRQGLQTEAITAAETALSHEPGNISAIAVLTEIHKVTNPSLALETIKEGIEQQEDSDVFKLMQISVYQASGEIDRAFEKYDELISESPANLYYYSRYVTLLEAYDRHDRAISALEQAARIPSDNEQTKIWLVQYLVRYKGLDAAEAQVRAFLDETTESQELSLALGELLVAREQFEEAREYFGSLAREGDVTEISQKARFALARLEAHLGNEDIAETILSQMLELEPENPDALLTRANKALQQGDMEQAVTFSRSVLRNKPDSVSALELLAAAHTQAGSDDLALDSYRRLYDIDPRNPRALVALSRASIDDGDLERAENLATAALRLDPQNLSASQVLVAIYAQRGEMDQAIEQADEIASSSEGEVLGELLLARIATSEESYERAITHYQRVLDLQPQLVPALDGIAEAYLRGQDADKAKAFFVSHSEKHESNAHSQFWVARLLFANSEPDAGKKLLTEITKTHPRHTPSRILLGDLLVQEGDMGAAKVEYLAGLEVEPENTSLLMRVAQASELAEDFDQAIELYEKVLELDDELVVARNNVAVLYADHRPSPDNLGRAISLMRGYASSTEPALLDTLGWVYYKLDEYEQAVRYLSDAIAAGTSDPTIRFHLGMALAKAGRHADARTHLEQAIESGSSNDWVQEARDVLASI